MTADSAPARLARLLTLVPWLLNHDGVTIAEAAAHFRVSEQVMEKDLWLLIVCGLPGYGPDQLVDIQFWDDGVIHVIDPLMLDRPLRLTRDEATSMIVALRMMAQIVPTTPALVSVTERLAVAVGEGETPVFEPDVVIVDGSSTPVLDAVTSALDSSRILSITYAAGTRDEVTIRDVEPLAVQSVDGRTTVIAYCRSAEAIRSFRIDRILSARAGEHFTPRVLPDPSAAEGSDSSVAAVRCTLMIDATARWAVDVFDLDVVAEEEDGSVRAGLVAHDRDWIIRMVLGLRGQAEVIAPEDLRSDVAMAAERAIEAQTTRQSA